MPTTVANQKVITISKEPCDKDHIYAKINLNALKLALNALTPAELKLWLYFAKNQNNHVFALSPQDAEEWKNSRTTFNRTITKFIDEGYLIGKEGSNRYTFYEIPKEKGTFTPYHGKPREEEKGRDFSWSSVPTVMDTQA